MAKFEIEIWLDGYDTEEEMEEACFEWIYQQLNFAASRVEIRKIEEPQNAKQ